jgi:hypothetical protein
VKRITSIVFLLLFLFNFAGIYFYFGVRIFTIKQEMRAALKNKPDSELTRLELPVAEFERSRVDEHEVKVNGKMFDIARIQFAGDRVIIFCLHDEAEDNLLSFLDAVSSRAHNDKHPVPGTIVQFLSLTFLVTYFTFDASTVDYSFAETHYNESMNSLPIEVISPPPRT